jgi:hypothetical protein
VKREGIPEDDLWKIFAERIDRCSWTIRDETARPRGGILSTMYGRDGGRRKGGLMSRKRTRLINIMIMRLLPPRPFMLTAPRFLRVLAVYMTSCALTIFIPKKKPPVSPSSSIITKRKRKERKDKTKEGRKRKGEEENTTHLQVWSKHPGSGLPQAIFLSLQNKHANACFFSVVFLEEAAAAVSFRIDWEEPG